MEPSNFRKYCEREVSLNVYPCFNSIAQISLLNTNPKMVKHCQTIRRQIADDLFKCVWPCCGVGAERVRFKTIFRIAQSVFRIQYFCKKLQLRCLTIFWIRPAGIQSFKNCFESLNSIWQGDLIKIFIQFSYSRNTL